MHTSEAITLTANSYNKMLAHNSKVNILSLINRILHGNCIDIMGMLPDGCIDLICTDPPYLINYKDRSNRSIANDDNDEWLYPAFSEAYRVLKNNGLCISFYAWNRVFEFSSCWKEVGFYPVGHLVFAKDYASKSRYLNYTHESCYYIQ